MKFKVGDRVKVIDKGSQHYGKTYEITEVDTNWGYPYRVLGVAWFKEDILELVERAKHRNLLPIIAEELGVAIGEEFEIGKDTYKFTEHDFYWLNGGNDELARNVFYDLIKGQSEIKKLPSKPLLSKEEYIVLKNIDKRYKWMAKDFKHKHVHLYVGRPTKQVTEWNDFNSMRFQSLWLFGNLFKFVSFDDEEPYNIQSLLEEYEKYVKEK